MKGCTQPSFSNTFFLIALLWAACFLCGLRSKVFKNVK